MRVHVLFAHPVETSFSAGLHLHVVETLRKGGHTIDDCDLYAEDFQPVLTRAERLGYHTIPDNLAPVSPYVERLRAADALVLVFPVWNFGFPAILKGYFDRVFLPGVSFSLNPRGGIALELKNIKRLAAVCTYGGKRTRAILAGDPPRKIVTRQMRRVINPFARCTYDACYDMNNTTAEKRAAFLHRVETRFSGW